MGESEKNRIFDILSKCDISYKDRIFSRETIIREHIESLLTSLCTSEHDSLTVLHTGSKLFDAATVATVALSNILLNSVNSIDIINSLNEGDMVLYVSGGVKGRWVFRRIYKEKIDAKTTVKYVLLTQDISESKKAEVKVPEKRWGLITPYFGNAVRQDNRGIRKTKSLKDDFYHMVLGFGEDEEIPTIVNQSSVFVVSKETSDDLINNLSFVFGDKSKIKLLDIVTATRYTENNEYIYGGNAAKIDPVLKFTDKPSVARDLIRQKGGNKILGVLFMGDDVFKRSETELPEFINRKSLKYVVLSVKLGNDLIHEIQSYENMRYFACTKSYLSSKVYTPIIKNDINDELSYQIKAIKERTLVKEIIHSNLTWKEYSDFRRNLYLLKQSDYKSDYLNDFIRISFSMMNLFSTIIFPLYELEKLIENKTLGSIDMPAVKLEKLQKLSLRFPNTLDQYTNEIINSLSKMYDYLKESSEKETFVMNFIQAHSYDRIAIIVPKQYYQTILNYYYPEHFRDNELISISTENGFDSNEIYDDIIYTGSFAQGKKFNIFKCRSARKIIVPIYEYEKSMFSYKKKESDNEERVFDNSIGQSYINDDKDDKDDSKFINDEVKYVNSITYEVNDYIDKFLEDDNIYKYSYSHDNDSENVTSEIVAVATFEDGERAFFSKSYKAYVLDETTGEVKEVNANELSEGDSVVFTSHDNQTHDIVDYILLKLLEGKNIDDNLKKSYENSRKWKNELLSYINSEQLTVKQIVNSLHNFGTSVTEPTVRNWLDDDSHIVGPREADSLKAIGILVGDSQLQNNPQEIIEDCSTIRNIRIKILKSIGEAIINKLSGKNVSLDLITPEISEQIDSLAIVLQVEQIVTVKKSVPIYLINKPLRKGD